MDLQVKQQEIRTTLNGVVNGYDVSLDYSHVKDSKPEYIGINVHKGGTNVSGGYYAGANQLNLTFNNYQPEDVSLVNDLYNACVDLTTEKKEEVIADKVVAKK